MKTRIKQITDAPTSRRWESYVDERLANLEKVVANEHGLPAPGTSPAEAVRRLSALRDEVGPTGGNPRTAAEIQKRLSTSPADDQDAEWTRQTKERIEALNRRGDTLKARLAALNRRGNFQRHSPADDEDGAWTRLNNLAIVRGYEVLRNDQDDDEATCFAVAELDFHRPDRINSLVEEDIPAAKVIKFLGAHNVMQRHGYDRQERVLKAQRWLDRVSVDDLDSPEDDKDNVPSP